MAKFLMKTSDCQRKKVIVCYQKRSVLLLACVALAACGVTPLGPNSERPVLEVPASLTAKPAGASSTVVDWLAWWQSFQDPVLDALLQEAAANSQDLKLASARIDEARTAILLNDANFVPGVDLTAGASRKRGSQNASTFNAAAGPYSNDRQIGLQASYEIDFWGKYARADEAARARLLAQSATRGTVQTTLYANVVQAYVNLRALDAQLTLAEQTLATRQENLRLQQRRFQGGVVGELDLRQAESEAASVQATAQQTRQSRGNAEAALALLVGRSPAAIANPVLARGAEFDALFARQSVPANLPSDLLNRRPDVVSAEQALMAANADIGQARSVYFPRLSFTAALGQQSKDFGNLFSPASLFWSLAGNLAQPIFHGGSGDATVAAATARQRQALAQYTQAVQSAFRDVHDALNNVDAGREVAATTAQRIAALKSSLRLSQLRYQSGYSPYLEVLNAQRDLAQAEVGLIEVQRGQLVAVVGLYKALGGGWDAGALEARRGDGK